MLSCSIWFSAPSFWKGGGLESRCVGRVCGADCGESHGTIGTVHTTYAAALKITTHPKPRCRKPYGETQLLMLLMMSAEKISPPPLPWGRGRVVLDCEIFSWDTCKVRSMSQIRTRYRN